MRTFSSFTILSAITAAMWTTPLSAEDGPAYRWREGEQVAYELRITAELPTKTETLTGIISYTVESASDPAKLTFQSLEGSSQLPYLLGNLSLLVFEPLPESAQKSWTEENGITITQKGNQSNDPFGGRFGPRFDPFNRFQSETPEKTKAGGERLSFTWQAEQSDVVTYGKKYEMYSPGDTETVTVSGTGTWKFNRRLGLPEALDFKQDLVREENNTKITIPVSIKYHRLTDQQWANVLKQREEAAQKAKEAHEKRMAELAEAKRQASAPLEPDQKQELLAALQSDDPSRMVGGLTTLAGRTPTDPDPEVASAIESLVNHANKLVREKASAALVNWSPDYKRKQALNKAYRGPAFVKDLGRPLTPDTPLFVGQIVAAKDTGAWYSAKIEEMLPDGQVRVTFPGWGARKSTVSRANIQLAPDEVEQPYLAASELAVLQGEKLPRSRTWTDVSGKFKIQAEMLRLDGDRVVLKRTSDGREVPVPLSKLSEADREAAKALAEQTENPFEPDNPFAP